MVYFILQRQQRGLFWEFAEVSVDLWLYPDDSAVELGLLRHRDLSSGTFSVSKEGYLSTLIGQQLKFTDEIVMPNNLKNTDGGDMVRICLNLLLALSSSFSEFAEEKEILDESSAELVRKVLQRTLALKTDEGLKTWLPIVSQFCPYSNPRIRQILFEHFWKVFMDEMRTDCHNCPPGMSENSSAFLLRVKGYREQRKNHSWNTWDYFFRLLVTICESGYGLRPGLYRGQF